MHETSRLDLNAHSIQTLIDGLIKPVGSLGKWEQLAARLCAIQKTYKPLAGPIELVIFAADHGVLESGVSLWPASVTSLMIEQIAIGKSASAVLSDLYGVDYRVVDVGSFNAPAILHPKLSSRRIGPGTRNLSHEPAMTLHEMHQALSIGADEARMTMLRDANIVIAGEMGIGNTTAASCLAVLLADVPLEHAVGPGAGANESTLEAKSLAVRSATSRVLERCGRTIDEAALAEVGGFEIAAMAGFFIQAAQQKQTILLDGMIATAGGLIAQQFYPEVTNYMIAASLSEEPAHSGMLRKLGLAPFLEWNMRLGEGTGALALVPLVQGAAAWFTHMGQLKQLI
jgi:nicotinate-nucleotide--dimethylbenzimidazole phosphoribosyltransferase